MNLQKVNKIMAKEICKAPLETTPIEVTKDMEEKILKEGGSKIDKTGTPFEGADEIFQQTVNEIGDSFNTSDESIDFYKNYSFTPEEIRFIKEATPRKVFHIKRLGNISFIKTGDNKLMLAETYQHRLECGLVNLDKKLSEAKGLIKNMANDMEFAKRGLLKFTTETFIGRIKLAIRIVFKGGING